MDFYGTSNPDTFRGTDNPDRIYGFSGDDALFGGGGDDLIKGGFEFPLTGYTDDDFIVGDNEGQAGNDEIWGGSGNDIIYGDNNTGRSNAGGNDTIYAGSGNDKVYGGSGNDKIDGGEGDDVLYGDFEAFDIGNDYIDGGAGNDTMIGGYGDDTYVVNSSGDVIIESSVGGSGLDYVLAYTNYTLPENVERLVYNGTTSFVGVGNNSDNYLQGGLGDDQLSGQNGDDLIYGGAGSDAIFGGSGHDIASYSGNYTEYNLSFSITGAVRVTSSQGTDLLTGIERIEFGGGGFYNVRVGDGGDNRLTSDPNVTSFLFGGGGNDTLTGGIGNDNLAGSSGNDVLIGGYGSDVLTGGVGADKFRFNAKTEGIDLIKDFNRGEGDKIQIVKSSFSATSLSQFSYNSTTGSLLFGSTQIADLQNKPTGFSVTADVVLV
jgi:Ca2+-binding RTX toxin-like protein